MDSDVLALEELDKTIHSLVELRKHLAKKVDQQKEVVPMDDFLDMLRKEIPSFKIIVEELERFRLENGFDGVVISAGLYGIDEPRTNVWWTTVNPIDKLLSNEIDLSTLFDLLANPARIHLLKFLTVGSKTYSEISEQLKIRGGGFAHHATPLLRMRCIEKVSRGRYNITERGWELLVTILSLATRLNRE